MRSTHPPAGADIHRTDPALHARWVNPTDVRMPALFQRPWVRFMAAHVIACYACVGAIASYRVLAPDNQPTPKVEPGFHDANGSGFDDADEPDDPWFLKPSIIAVAAPVSVPCLLLVALFLTVASPVEQFPIGLSLTLVALYLVPLGVAYALFRLRARKTGSQ